ncbi:hypothetical protein ACFL1M_02885 [Patescibacteria group bacterium]
MSEGPPGDSGNDSSPPPGLSGKDLANWWRDQGVHMDSVPTLNADERECPMCGANNPCTGVSTCVQCETNIDGDDVKRITNSTQHNPEWVNTWNTERGIDEID